jgi:Ca2+-transporting ATPase
MALAAPESTVSATASANASPAERDRPRRHRLVEAGDKIPADARLTEEANLQTDEAPLTARACRLQRGIRSIDEDVGLGDRRNMLFSGTVATYGRGRAVVVATGMATEVGRIAAAGNRREGADAAAAGARTAPASGLSIIMLAICGVVFATGLISSPVMNLMSCSACSYSPSRSQSRPSRRHCRRSSLSG